MSWLRLRVARWSHCIELQWAGYFYVLHVEVIVELQWVGYFYVLHVEVIVLNFNELVTFAHYTWLPRDQSDLCLI